MLTFGKGRAGHGSLYRQRLGYGVPVVDHMGLNPTHYKPSALKFPVTLESCTYRGAMYACTQEGCALGARAMAGKSQKEIPRCRSSSQRTIRTHLTLSNKVRRPMAASCG